MDTLLQNLRYAVRTLRKSPGFTVVAVLTLALGIGANTALFSVTRAVLLRPLPYPGADRIVQVWNPWSNQPEVSIGRSPLSPLDIADAREQIASFEHLAAYSQGTANLTGSETPERVVVTRASADIFAVLATGAALGRTFGVEEDAPGRDDVVVLSHGLWRRQFGSDPAAVGSSVRLDGVVYTVVGVMPPEFRLPEDFLADRPTEIWKPLALGPAGLQRGYHWLHAVARLRPGASVATANQELESLTRHWIEQGFKVRDLPPFYAVPIAEEIFGSIRPALLVLFGAVGFVLLIACVNVANLVLVRSDARRKEMAVRAALGAGRGRIVAQLLTESALLAALGAVFGLLLAYLGVQALVSLDPAGIPRLEEVRLDRSVLGFTAAVAGVTGLLFGLVPAIQATRLSLVGQLKEGQRVASPGRSRRFRSALASAEIALSVVLVIGAALMVRTFWELSRTDLGFRPERVLTFGVSLPAADYGGDRTSVFYRELIERLEGLPRVRSAAAVGQLPLTGRLGGTDLEVEGRPPPRPGEGLPNARRQVVTPGYFETLGHQLVAGRFLDAGDRAEVQPVIVVNQTMAEMFWPGGNAVGKQVRGTNSGTPWFTVVGVVRDSRQSGVIDPASPTMYFTHEQYALTGSSTPRDMAIAIRTGADPLALASAAREVVRALDPNLPVSDIRTMDDILGDALAQPRFTMLLLAIFAAIALALAMIGIYGVMSYAVGQRTHEIGVRMALGASAGQVLRLMVGSGLMLALIGIGVGIGVAMTTTRVLSGLLYGVGATDPVTFLGVAVALAAIALLASYLPARRATRVDPMIALRVE